MLRLKLKGLDKFFEIATWHFMVIQIVCINVKKR